MLPASRIALHKSGVAFQVHCVSLELRRLDSAWLLGVLDTMENNKSCINSAAGGQTTVRQTEHAKVMRGRSSLLLRIFFGLLPSVCFYGCALPLGPKASVTPNRAFISYWPADGGSGKLRLAVKDIIDMKGTVTTAGSQYLAKTSPPAARDAKCLNSARQSNVQIVGKTNLTELALGVTGMNEFYGTPTNPLAGNRIPGGSSSGSAVAVADGQADVAYGSDTGGSIRVPAACCGILGLKTTFGLVPLDGVFPLSPKHLDSIGPMAKDVPNLVRGMELLDPGFSVRYKAAIANKPSAKEIRIGRLYLDGTDPRIERALDDALTAAGFSVIRLNERSKSQLERTTAGFRPVRFNNPFKEQWEKAQLDGSAVAVGDGWLNNRKYLGKLGVALTTQATIQLGQLQYNIAYKGALKAQSDWQRTLGRVFDVVDFIALPTLKTFPPRKLLFERSAISEARMLALQNTVAVNYAGNPAIAIPIPAPGRGFPLTSLQLIGPHLNEAGLVNAARLIMTQQ
jgi:amidase